MICYGTSQAGAEHERLGRECQDTYMSGKAGRYTITVVADGLGSAARSKEGSSAACEYLLNALSELLTDDACDTVKAMKLAFCAACTAVLSKARDEGMQPSVFETTLSAVIADGNSVTYGHVGDGGIAMLTPEGRLGLLTSRQSGFYEGSVYPLVNSFKSCVFERVEGSWNVLLLATDGMLNFLSSLSVGRDRENYISAFYKGAFDGSSGRRKLESYLLRAVKDEQLLNHVDDDRTLAFVVNENVGLNPRLDIDFSDRRDGRISKITDEYESGDFVRLCQQLGLDSRLLPEHLAAQRKAEESADQPFEPMSLPEAMNVPSAGTQGNSGKALAVILSLVAVALTACVMIFFLFFAKKSPKDVTPTDISRSDTVTPGDLSPSDKVSESDAAGKAK